MPSFVLLWHQTPAGYPRESHFDLMLEQGGALHTWAMGKLPLPGQTVEAEQLPDHRLDYLTYEGDVAGDRGRVIRIDSGECQFVLQTSGAVVAKLWGSQLRGTLTLNQDELAAHRWRVSLAVD